MPPEIALLRYGQISEWWGELHPLVEKAVETTDGRQNADDFLLETITGAISLWVVHDYSCICAVVSTRLIDYPRKRMLSVQLCAGSRMKEWLDKLIDELEIFAKHHNCAGIEGIGRLGWTRAIEKKGYKQRHVFIEKNFDEV